MKNLIKHRPVSKHHLIADLVLSAVFFALGFVLPFLTGQIPQIGNMMLPMHFPVFLCGLICGWQYGAVIGLALPLFRSAVMSMPPFFPTATGMAVELLTYGLVSGLIYRFFPKKGGWWDLLRAYAALVPAMLIGRGVWGLFQLFQLSVSGSSFTFAAFISGAFATAFPGIILQLLLIPAIMVALEKSGLIRKKNGDSAREYLHPIPDALIEQILNTVESLRNGDEVFIVAIDGRCGSGKSTLADTLHVKTGFPLIRMDDFFLRPEQRNPARLSVPGENIDHERFLSEVLSPLKEGKDAVYRPYDPHQDKFGDPIVIHPKGVIFVEGSYCFHPDLRDRYDFRIFMTVDPKEQLKRIGRRKQHNDVKAFKEKWIPLEEAYFSSCKVEECANLVIDTGESKKQG